MTDITEGRAVNEPSGLDGIVRVLGVAWALLMVTGAALMIWWADATTVSRRGMAPGVGVCLLGVALAAHCLWRPRQWPVTIVLVCLAAFTAASIAATIAAAFLLGSH
ncbi:MAG: hypothetical protein U0Y82_05830 [Thermoleophilia bacterium]